MPASVSRSTAASHVVDDEIEHGMGRRNVIVLRRDEDVGAAAEVEREAAHLLLHHEAERFFVEVLRRRDVVGREAGEGSVVLEHVRLLSQAACSSSSPASADAWASRMKTAATTPAASAKTVPTTNAAW